MTPRELAEIIHAALLRTDKDGPSVYCLDFEGAEPTNSLHLDPLAEDGVAPQARMTMVDGYVDFERLAEIILKEIAQTKTPPA